MTGWRRAGTPSSGAEQRAGDAAARRAVPGVAAIRAVPVVELRLGRRVVAAVAVACRSGSGCRAGRLGSPSSRPEWSRDRPAPRRAGTPARARDDLEGDVQLVAGEGLRSSRGSIAVSPWVRQGYSGEYLASIASVGRLSWPTRMIRSPFSLQHRRRRGWPSR